MFWKGVVIGFLAAGVLLVIGAYCYFGMGIAPVATASQPMPFEKFLASRALHATIGKSADKPSPVEATEPNLKNGAGKTVAASAQSAWIRELLAGTAA